MRKRLIALLLSLMMTLVLLPASFAEEDPAAENPEPAESLEPAEGLRAGNVSIDSTNFPDDNFRNYVQYDLLHADPSYFTPAEIADITVINCGYRLIENLQGIELFTSLETLICQDNRLMDIDVSAMPSLKKLDCHSNPLSGTIQIHVNLEELECWNSQIDGTRILIPRNSRLRVVKVDASGFSDLSFLYGLDLETLDCAYIDFESLDFTPWNNLHDLRCDNCNLSRLNVSGLLNLTRIRANDNNLTELDVSIVPALEELYVNNNHIAALDLSACPNLWGAELNQTADGLMTEDSGHYLFDLTSIGVADASKVTISDTDWTLDSVTGVATYNGSGIPNQLDYTYDTGNAAFPMQVTVTLGVAVTVDPNDFDPGFFNWLLNKGIVNDSGNGVYTISSAVTELDCSYEGLTSLNGIGYFQNLERLNCQDNELDSIDVSGMPSLKVLDCHSNPLSGTIAFHENLEELECWNSQIEGSRVLIPANSNLRVIKVDASEFGSLSVLNGLALETLDCPYHDYGTLDFTAWPTLRDFRCDSCNLTSLTVAGLANLTRICANANDLTEIDLTGLTSLEELYINDNHIAELDLPAGVTLDSAELDQRIKGQMLTDNGDGTYSFDLSALVTNLGNVTVRTAGATLSNGVVTFTSQPSELVYTYDIGDANFPMQVIVELGLPANAPTVAVKTLSLSGQIGVNFYMDLSCLSEEEKEDSYMEFTINGRTERADFDPSFTNPSKGVYYGFTCHIASIEMADEITAEFHYGDDKTVGTTYTAQAYIQGALESPDYPQDAKALVKATADYGHYVQAYLKEVKNWPDDEHVTIKAGSEIGEAEIAAAAAAAAATEDWSVTVNVPEGAFVRSLGYSLMLDDMVTLILSVRTESGHALSSARIGEETLPIEGGAGGRYRVRIENIMAHQLGNRYTIVLNAGGEDAEITVSPMSYVKTLLTASAYENNMTAKQAAAAIYQYYQAAIAYIDARKAH